MLAQRRRRWPNLMQTLGGHLLVLHSDFTPNAGIIIKTFNTFCFNAGPTVQTVGQH